MASSPPSSMNDSAILPAALLLSPDIVRSMTPSKKPLPNIFLNGAAALPIFSVATLSAPLAKP